MQGLHLYSLETTCSICNVDCRTEHSWVNQKFPTFQESVEVSFKEIITKATSEEDNFCTDWFLILVLLHAKQTLVPVFFFTVFKELE